MPQGFSTPCDYLCNLMKSSSETASDVLTHSIMTCKSSNETLPLVGKPNRQKVFDLLSSILDRLSDLDESTVATLIKDHSESAADISAILPTHKTKLSIQLLRTKLIKVLVFF
eukprot:scaffold54532_cov41-Cyclotella_meneghiniana.AAC.1